VDPLSDPTAFASTCREVVELVTDYLEGTLPAGVRRAMDDHLAGCDGCTNYLDQIRATISAVGRLRLEALPSATQRSLVVEFMELVAGRNDSG
jgi:anti-sigma factor RsiW